MDRARGGLPAFYQALGNVLKGGGVEKRKTYSAVSEFKFCGIGNVHAVRRAYNMLAGAGGAPKLASRWIGLQSLVLRAGLEAVAHLERGASVLLHCSDGWDRTPQVPCTFK